MTKYHIKSLTNGMYLAQGSRVYEYGAWGEITNARVYEDKTDAKEMRDCINNTYEALGLRAVIEKAR